MAYTSGIAANPTALATAIENFCTTNGFTLNAGAGSWLSKGKSHVRLFPWGGNVVSFISRSGNIATVSMGYTHSLTPGDTVVITQASDPLYNGVFTVLDVPTGSTFRYTMTGTPSANAVATGQGSFILFAAAFGTTNTVAIAGANSADGLTEFCPFVKFIWVTSGEWPIAYELFYSGSPDQVVCVIKHGVGKIQTILFGDIVKINEAAYVGGNWFFASRAGTVGNLPIGISLISDTGIDATQGTRINPNDLGGLSVPFCGNLFSGVKGFTEGLLAKIDGSLWHSSSGTGYKISNVTYTDTTYAMVYRSPNSWNSQTHLVPMNLQFKDVIAGYRHSLGYVEHMRLCRIDNYEIGDVIALGTDQWKVYPWVQKDVVNRNGLSISGKSGTLGFAVRYVP